MSRREAVRRAGMAVVALGVLPALQACGSGDDDDQPAATTSPATPSATTHRVNMNARLAFDPDQLTIAAGDTVTWVTVGRIPHTTTCDAGMVAKPENSQLPPGAQPWNSGLVSSGGTYSVTFTVSGDYVYFCIPHEAAGMVARLTVTD